MGPAAGSDGSIDVVGWAVADPPCPGSGTGTGTGTENGHGHGHVNAYGNMHMHRNRLRNAANHPRRLALNDRQSAAVAAQRSVGTQGAQGHRIMKTAKKVSLYALSVSALALLLAGCIVAPESSPESSPESAEITPPSDTEALSSPATTYAVCACHVVELNGKLRCITSCPAGMVCAGPYQVCQNP